MGRIGQRDGGGDLPALGRQRVRAAPRLHHGRPRWHGLHPRRGRDGHERHALGGDVRGGISPVRQVRGGTRGQLQRARGELCFLGDTGHGERSRLQLVVEDSNKQMPENDRKCNFMHAILLALQFWRLRVFQTPFGVFKWCD